MFVYCNFWACNCTDDSYSVHLDIHNLVWLACVDIYANQLHINGYILGKWGHVTGDACVEK